MESYSIKFNDYMAKSVQQLEAHVRRNGYTDLVDQNNHETFARLLTFSDDTIRDEVLSKPLRGSLLDILNNDDFANNFIDLTADRVTLDRLLQGVRQGRFNSESARIILDPQFQAFMALPAQTIDEMYPVAQAFHRLPEDLHRLTPADADFMMRVFLYLNRFDAQTRLPIDNVEGIFQIIHPNRVGRSIEQILSPETLEQVNQALADRAQAVQPDYLGEIVYRYRSRILYDYRLWASSFFIRGVRTSTNMLFLSNFWDTDTFFRQVHQDLDESVYDEKNVYTWIPSVFAQMIAHRRDIWSREILPVQELLQREDQKDASYLQRIRAGQINSNFGEEIVLYLALQGHDVSLLKDLTAIELTQLITLAVRLPALQASSDGVAVIRKAEYSGNVRTADEFLNALRRGVKAYFSDLTFDVQSRRLYDLTEYIGDAALKADNETIKRVIQLPIHLQKILYVIMGSPSDRMFLTPARRLSTALITGQMLPVEYYQERLYLLSEIMSAPTDDKHQRIVTNRSLAVQNVPDYIDRLDPSSIGSRIASYHPKLIEVLLKVDTKNVMELARSIGLDLTYLDLERQIHPTTRFAPADKLATFRSQAPLMNSYLERPVDQEPFNFQKIVTYQQSAGKYSDFELRDGFNLPDIYDRESMTPKIVFTLQSKKLEVPLDMRTDDLETVTLLSENGQRKVRLDDFIEQVQFHQAGSFLVYYESLAKLLLRSKVIKGLPRERYNQLSRNLTARIANTR